MPTKPKLTRKTRQGKIVPNEKATAFGGRSLRRDASQKTDRALSGALQMGNADYVAIANEIYWDDIERQKPAWGRWSRVNKALMARVGCSVSTASRAMRDAELLRAADATEQLPMLRHRVMEQLHRIADKQEDEQPLAAVRALSEIASIGGLYAPQKIEVVPSEALELEAIIRVISPRGKAALDVLLEEIEVARSQGLLPAAGGTGQGEVVDAEIVEPGAGGN